MNYVLIFAGGIGSRMGASLPKQFLKIDNKEIIAHVIEKFNSCNSVDEIVIVTLKDYINEVRLLVDKYRYRKVRDVIEGGATAFESQRNGVLFLNSVSNSESDIVIIHDGVRPFVDSNLIKKCFEEVKLNGNAIVVSPASETIAILDSSDKIYETISRQKCLLARAPQAFYLKDLYNAHLKAKKENKQYIDSASMFLDQKIILNPVEGPVENIKITTQYDYLLAKLLIEGKNEKNR